MASIPPTPQASAGLGVLNALGYAWVVGLLGVGLVLVAVLIFAGYSLVRLSNELHIVEDGLDRAQAQDCAADLTLGSPGRDAACSAASALAVGGVLTYQKHKLVEGRSRRSPWAEGGFAGVPSQSDRWKTWTTAERTHDSCGSMVSSEPPSTTYGASNSFMRPAVRAAVRTSLNLERDRERFGTGADRSSW